MNRDEHLKLHGLRRALRGSNYFAFEKNGKYLLYREGEQGARNTLVISSSDVDRFCREARIATGVQK